MKQPTQCVFCKYKNKKDLESKILAGQTTMSEAGRIIGVSYQSISRHMNNHVKKETRELAETLRPDIEKTGAGSLINAAQTLQNILLKTEKIIINAEKVKDYDLMLKAMDQSRKSLETAAKLFAEVLKPKEDNTIKIEIEYL